MQTEKASAGVTVDLHTTPASIGGTRVPIGLSAIVIALIAATVVALTQRPHPDVLRTDFDTWDWWISPLEGNPAARLPRTDADLFGLCSSENDLWVTGRGGLIMHSGDGGQHWQAWIVNRPGLQPQRWNKAQLKTDTSPQEPGQAAMPFELPNEQQMVSPQQTPQKSIEGKKTTRGEKFKPQKQASRDPFVPWENIPPELFFPACANGGRVWIPGSAGWMYQSADAGASWKAELVADAPLFQAFARGNGDVLASSFERGTWHKESGSTVWTPLQGFPCVDGVSRLRSRIDPGPKEKLEDFVVVCMEEADIYQQNNGEWQTISNDSRVANNDAVRGIGRDEWILATDSGPAALDLKIGRSRQIPLRDDQGERMDDAGVISLSQVGNTIWMVGQEGLVAKLTADQYPVAYSVSEKLRFDISDSEVRPDLISFQQDGRGQLWVSGEDATLAFSPDDGDSWFPAVLPIDYTVPEDRAWRLPAPWYFTIIILGLLLSRHPAVRGWTWAIRSAGGPESLSTVAERAVSDAPLKPGDPDPVGIGRIALGISRFIRNRRTDPRLTIAITGNWGSGKSSLMNLLRHDLERFGMEPVWFNAWHHQKGEQLLASLYANIREQGIPPWASLPGLVFRFRLVSIRVRRNPLGAVIAVALLYLGIVVHHYSTEISRMWPDFAMAWKAMSSNIGVDGSVLASLVPVAPALGMFIVALRAFGLQPNSLHKLQGETSRFRNDDLKPVARYHFAQQFGEVTQALGPRRMVVFVDDLDRCEPAYVVEILEAINLLVTSGDCFVVMGMDPRWVRSCISLRYRDIAEEIRATAPDSGSDSFAKNYLEKLVNITVPIPKAPPNAALMLLTSPAPVRTRLSVDTIHTWLRHGVIAGLLGLTLYFGVLALLTPAPTADSDSRPFAAAATETNPPSTENEYLGATPSKRAIIIQNTDQASQVVVLEIDQAPWWFWLCASGLVIAIVLWQPSGREPLVLDDSDNFNHSIRIWLPWIAAMHKTPRSLKRFVNRLRFSAMRASTLSSDTPPSPQNLLDRLRSLVAHRFGAQKSSPRRRTVPEENLVALAAMTDVVGKTPQDWRDLALSLGAHLDQRLTLGLPPFDGTLEQNQQLHRHLVNAVARYQEAFPDSSSPSQGTMKMIQELVGERPKDDAMDDDDDQEGAAEPDRET